MKTLQILSTAYRCTVEEQDDPIVWITHALKGAGADVDLLLRGNGVNYAVKGQNAEGISFGEWKQTHPPRIDHDVESLSGKGVNVYVVSEDARERGIEPGTMIGGIKTIDRAEMAGLFDKYERIWNW